MSVHQIHEFYIHLDIPNLNDSLKQEIVKLVDNYGSVECEFDDDSLTVEMFQSESEAIKLETDIKRLINNHGMNLLIKALAENGIEYDIIENTLFAYPQKNAPCVQIKTLDDVEYAIKVINRQLKRI